MIEAGLPMASTGARVDGIRLQLRGGFCKSRGRLAPQASRKGAAARDRNNPWVKAGKIER